MAKFEFDHKGHVYQIEADDEKSADEKFAQALKEFNAGDEKTAKDQEEKRMEGKSKWGQVFQKGTDVLNKIPGLKTTGDVISPSLMKGIPVVKHYVPQTEELDKFETEHPWAAKGLNIAGGTGAMLPAAGAASGYAGNYLLNQILAQGTLGAGINSADTFAEKGKDATSNDYINSALWGVGSGAATALVPGVFGTAPKTTNTFKNEFKDFMKIGGHRFPSGATRPYPANNPVPVTGTGREGLSEENVRRLGAALAAAGGAKYSPHGAFMGMLEGGAAGHFLAPAFDVARSGIRHPGTQDILRALSLQGQSQYKDAQSALPNPQP